MSPSPDALGVARWIMQHELGEREAPEEIARGVERCFQRLHEALRSLVGVAGVEALVGRAVHLAQPEHGWIETAVVPARSNVVFEGLAGRVEREGAPAVIDGMTALLAHLIGLLFTFIGEELALRIVQRIWTEVPRPAESRGASTTGGK
ncbi:hypothetical protein [Sorangium sp. So ce128]|uniref:hypothetical protein n=1 Tax=Sorangium sp. So ce128 TaxID=3133281 RepID=UPI003F646632